MEIYTLVIGGNKPPSCTAQILLSGAYKPTLITHNYFSQMCSFHDATWTALFINNPHSLCDFPTADFPLPPHRRAFD